jgi:hypothetical protein
MERRTCPTRRCSTAPERPGSSSQTQARLPTRLRSSPPNKLPRAQVRRRDPEHPAGGERARSYSEAGARVRGLHALPQSAEPPRPQQPRSVHFQTPRSIAPSPGCQQGLPDNVADRGRPPLRRTDASAVTQPEVSMTERRIHAAEFGQAITTTSLGSPTRADTKTGRDGAAGRVPHLARRATRADWLSSVPTGLRGASSETRCCKHRAGHDGLGNGAAARGVQR